MITINKKEIGAKPKNPFGGAIDTFVVAGGTGDWLFELQPKLYTTRSNTCVCNPPSVLVPSLAFFHLFFLNRI